MSVPETTLAAAPVAMRWAPTAALIAATSVLNVILAAGLAEATDASEDFQALQPGPVAFATAISLVVGAAVLDQLCRRTPERARQVFTVMAVVIGLLSCAAPLAMLGADATTVDGWSESAVLSLIPLHLVPTAAAAAMARLPR